MNESEYYEPHVLDSWDECPYCGSTSIADYHQKDSYEIFGHGQCLPWHCHSCGHDFDEPHTEIIYA